MKRIIIFFALMVPIFVHAASCDYSKLNEYNTLSSNIDYEVKRDNDRNKYEVTLINVYNGIYAKYNGVNYTSNNKNEIVISNIGEGENVSIQIYAPLTECNSHLRTINFLTEYYNAMYNDSRCDKYRKVLNICKYEYLSYKTNSSLLTSAIKNYENSYREPEEEEIVEKEPTILDNIKEFMTNWGIQILLVFISSAVTITIYKVKFRKIKHGI